MIVRIIAIKTGKVIGDIPVVLQGENYAPTEQDYFTSAWKCTVDDESVDPMRRGDYEFKLLRN